MQSIRLHQGEVSHHFRLQSFDATAAHAVKSLIFAGSEGCHIAGIFASHEGPTFHGMSFKTTSYDRGAIFALTTGSIGLRLYVNICYRSSKSQKVGKVWGAVGVSIQIGFKKVDSIGDDAVAAQSQQVLCGQVVVDGVA